MLLLGPYENVDGIIAEQKFLKGVSQHIASEYELYYHDISVTKVGLYKFYSRIRKAPSVPV